MSATKPYSIYICGSSQSGKYLFAKSIYHEYITKFIDDTQTYKTSNEYNLISRMFEREIEVDFGKFGLEMTDIYCQIILGRGDNISDRYMDEADMIFFVYDINDENSVKLVTDAVNRLGTDNGSSITFIANKIDIKAGTFEVDNNNDFSKDELKMAAKKPFLNDYTIHDGSTRTFCHSKGYFYCEMSIKYELWKMGKYGNNEKHSKIRKIFEEVVGKYHASKNPKKLNSDAGKCDTLSNVVYDCLAISISLADFITDVLMLYNYYINGWKAFFVISIIIMCIAQLSYCILFVYEYGHNEKIKCCKCWKQWCCGGLLFLCVFLIILG